VDETVAIVGLGYVGLPLAVGFVEGGLKVIGYDQSQSRRADLSAGRSPIDDVSDAALQRTLAAGFSVRAPVDGGLEDADAIFVCVATPINASREPDLTAVLSAAATISQGLRSGQMVILQSTTWPGTTNGPFREQLEQSGLAAGRDFALAFAPERVSPGDVAGASIRLPRLVGGVTPADTVRAARLLRALGAEVLEMTSADAAEMAKLLENVFRNVNIGLVNQLALLCERMGLDVWEIIDGAATKPFGFMAFRPGPGVGGHCIPVDPYYLAWRARQFGINDRFVELAGDINAAMPSHVVDLVSEALNDRRLPLNGSRVGVIGVAFKPNIGDPRNSPAREVITQLVRRGAHVTYHDPHVARFADGGGGEHISADLGDVLAGSDAVLVLVRHDRVDWREVYARATLVVDTVNSVRGQSVRDRQVLRLGAGWFRAENGGTTTA